MKVKETIRKLTLKAVLALVAGTTILAAGAGCNTSGEYQAYEMANRVSPGFAKLISPIPTHMESVFAGDAAVDNTEVKTVGRAGDLPAIHYVTQ